MPCLLLLLTIRLLTIRLAMLPSADTSFLASVGIQTVQVEQKHYSEVKGWPQLQQYNC